MARFWQHIPKPEARAALLSLGIGIGLMGLKFVAYFLTGSTVIFSDAVESIVNVSAAAFAVYSLVLSHLPADDEHPYGHGKVEFMSAGFEGGMIMVAGAVTAFKAIDALIHRPDIPERLDWGLLLMAVALLINGALGIFLIRIGKRRSSITLEADGWHLMSDAITSVVAIVALLLVKLTRWPFFDPLAALLVSVYIGRMGISLVRRAAAGLMDQQDKNDDSLLRRILDGHLGTIGKPPHICSYHKLRHRHSGRYHWVDFHVMVPAKWDVDQGHRVASAIEYEIEQALGEGNATAHIEPCVSPGCKNCASSIR